MENNWKFDDLEYTRTDFAEAARQVERDAQAVRDAADYAAVRKVFLEADQRVRQQESSFMLALLRSIQNVQDSYYGSEIGIQQKEYAVLKARRIAYYDALCSSPFRGELEQEFGKRFFEKAEIERRCVCEKNIPLQQRESELHMEFQKIMATCRIDFDGKILNLAGIQKYFEHEDRAVREAAYHKYSQFLESCEERLSDVWEEMISLRNEMGRNLGYENYLPLGYLLQGRVDFGIKDIEFFRQQVRQEIVPLCEKLYEAQRKRNHLDRLYAWDEKRVFPDGNAHPIGNDEFMVEQARQMYHELSPETGEFIDAMIDHGMMDLVNRPGKVSGGFMLLLPKQKMPFVFSNFNGTIGDVQVLTHELGHAFQGYESMRHQPIFDYFYETTGNAEIHSMAMEQFTYPYAERFFGKEADKYRFQHLQEAITFVPFGAAMDEFQQICYEQPGLTKQQRVQVWKDMERKYMPWRRYQNDPYLEKGGWWLHKMHIFTHPLFYVNYCLTTMAALDFKRRDMEDHTQAWEAYLRLCQSGGSRGYLETLRYAGIESPFLPGSVARSVSYAKGILLKEIEE